MIALRTEGKIEYDPSKMRITNNADANKYLKPDALVIAVVKPEDAPLKVPEPRAKGNPKSD